MSNRAFWRYRSAKASCESWRRSVTRGSRSVPGPDLALLGGRVDRYDPTIPAERGQGRGDARGGVALEGPRLEDEPRLEKQDERMPEAPDFQLDAGEGDDPPLPPAADGPLVVGLVPEDRRVDLGVVRRSKPFHEHHLSR